MPGASTIVIMGASGDLTRRKLLPALFQLACKHRLPENLRIVGFSRSEYSDDAFRELMWNGVRELGELAVPVPVITASLQARFRSRQDQPFGVKLLAAMRNQFGGHAVRRTD